LLETGGTTAGILHGCTAVDRLVDAGFNAVHYYGCKNCGVFLYDVGMEIYVMLFWLIDF
jgi:hypothetical protein